MSPSPTRRAIPGGNSMSSVPSYWNKRDELLRAVDIIPISDGEDMVSISETEVIHKTGSIVLTEGGDDCVGGVMGASGLPADFIVGDVFLQNVYTGEPNIAFNRVWC